MINVVVLTTGPLVDLATAKEHLRYTEDDQDDLISTYADAAVQSCLDYCDVKLVPVGAEPVFRASALLTLGDLWSVRSTQIVGTIIARSQTVENLLRPHRLIRI